MADHLVELSASSEDVGFLRDPARFGDLTDNPAFIGPYLATLRSLREAGPAATLANLASVRASGGLPSGRD